MEDMEDGRGGKARNDGLVLGEFTVDACRLGKVDTVLMLYIETEIIRLGFVIHSMIFRAAGCLFGFSVDPPQFNCSAEDLPLWNVCEAGNPQDHHYLI